MPASAIFVDELPVIGKVPMVFYIPQCKERNDIKLLIERHGGLVSDFHECFTF